MLKLMYITNDPAVAELATQAGVDIIFIDMETLGKAERQGNMDTVQLHHTPADIAAVRKVIGTRAKILARVNPLNPNSKQEIDVSVESGADMLMLPMWKTADDVRTFCALVGGRAETVPLLETRQADAALPELLRDNPADAVMIGLNDLHLSYHRAFMFELLSDGTVDRLCTQMRAAQLPFGFGGIARMGTGVLPAECILAEHYRLGSQSVILSRSFCNCEKIKNYSRIEQTMRTGVAELRAKEKELESWTPAQFEENHALVVRKVAQIVAGLKV